jgi:hypothetical protein
MPEMPVRLDRDAKTFSIAWWQVLVLVLWMKLITVRTTTTNRMYQHNHPCYR